MILTIEVNCDDSTHLYWREQGTSGWTQLAASVANAPTIEAGSATTTTFVFVQYTGSNHDVLYRDGYGGTPSLLPQSKAVDPGETELVFFSERSASPRWYAGYVKVPVAK